MAPNAHKTFISHALPRLVDDSRILGVAAEGSWVTKELDEYSDLDLLIVVENIHMEAVLAEKSSIATSLGTCIASFADDHVSSKNLLVCLYEDPLLHVDLKFVSLEQFTSRIENPEVIWERKGLLTKTIKENKPHIQHLNLQWVEDRFWIWIHYGALKVGRGEIFEALNTLSYIRSQALGPMCCVKSHKLPRGVRRIEQHCPEVAEAMRVTLASYNALECSQAFRSAAKIYVELRETLDKYTDLKINRRAEMAAMKFLHQVSDSLK